MYTEQEDALTLLFPDSTRVPVSIQDVSTSSDVAVADITVSLLSNYIFQNHSHDQSLNKLWSEGITPQKPSQLRLIYMGRPLNAQTKLSEIRLDLSRVIHVSVRPVDVEDKPQGQHKGGCCIIS